MLIIQELASAWALDKDLRRQALRWTWFRRAFQDALDSSLASQGVGCNSNQESLAKAFFDWAQSVDAHAFYEELDQIDFLHFTCGVLLQNLLQMRPPVLERLGSRKTPPEHAIDSAWSEEAFFAGFVLTLLQAFRSHLGLPALSLDATSMAGAHWASFRENVAEDATTAIAFLDQWCGLQPDWQTPSLIGSRPAMRQALDRSQKGS